MCDYCNGSGWLKDGSNCPSCNHDHLGQHVIGEGALWWNALNGKKWKFTNGKWELQE